MNVIAPGAGSLIGGLVRGGGLGYAADMEVMLAAVGTSADANDWRPDEG